MHFEQCTLSSQRAALLLRAASGMRLVVQRVLQAQVTVGGDVVGSIGPGLLCLVGIGRYDTVDDAKWAASKLLNARLWSDSEDRMWRRSVQDKGFEVLLVSQFTLHGYLKGTRPDFYVSMAPAEAEAFFNSFVDRVRGAYAAEKVQTGRFGNYMNVMLVGDGPVTIQLDSRSRGPPKDEPVGGKRAAARDVGDGDGDGDGKAEPE